MAKHEIFRNWAGNVQVRPAKCDQPENLEELRHIVRSAGRLRVQGSGHSFNDCVATDSHLLRTERLNRILSIDKERCLVKVEAGTKLAELNKRLWEEGFAFPSLGDIAQQAVAGLISTGTHGTGLKWGSFSDADSVYAVELVLANGELLELRTDRPEDAPRLAAARLALGALGVIYSITFKVDKAHHLELKSEVLSLSALNNAELSRQHDHFEYFPFPFTDKALVITRNRTDKPASSIGVASWIYDLVMENLMLDLLLRLSSWRPSSMPAVMGLIARLASAEHYIGSSHDVMASVRRIRFYEMEYAFASSRIDEVLSVYSDVNQFFANKSPKSERYYASFPGEVRFIRGDRGTMLSPTLGQETAFLAVQVHPSFGSGYESYFRAMEKEFRLLGGRPHWGKLFYENPAGLYPEFSHFAAIRGELDPKGKFLNDFMKRLLN